MNLKHIMAGVAAVATLLSGMAITGPAMAEDAGTATTRISADDLNKNVPLTVTANETDISKRSLNAVMLARYSFAQTDGTDITGFDLIDGGKATQVADALEKARISTTTTVEGGYAYDSSNPMVWVVQNLLANDKNNAGNLRTFLDKLKNETGIQKDTKDDNKLNPVTGNTDQQSTTVVPGVYVVFDNTAQGQASIAMMNGTGVYNGTTLLTKLKKTDSTIYQLGKVNYKTNETSISKKITKVSDNEHGSVYDGATSAEAAVGKKVTYQLTSKVPNWTGFDKFYYGITDTYTAGLKFDNDATVTVKAAGENQTEQTLGTNLYHVTEDSVNHKFTIKFGDANGDIIPSSGSFPVDAQVVVTYTATVTSDAASNTTLSSDDPDSNMASVEYSHNPNVWTDHQTSNSNKVYNYVAAFQIDKTDSNGQPLAGAEFQVTEKGKTEALKFIKDNASNENGTAIYRLADADDSSASATITVPKSGKVLLKGLDGEYTVTETKSPYNAAIKPSFGLTLKVDNPASDGTQATHKISVFTQDRDKLVSKNNNDHEVTVINARNLLDMPKTGATWLCIFGAMTVLLAGGAFLLLRKGKDSDRA